MDYNQCLRMIILSALVIALLTNGVGGGTAISIVLDNIVIQFNETTFQTFYHCLCTTPYQCEFSFKNTSNVITIQSYKQFPLSQNATFFDAFLCTIPMGTFSCNRLTTQQLVTTVPVNEPDKCSCVSYGNQTCFPRGVALLWAMGTYKVNITSENISQTNNCPDVISLSTSVVPSTTVQDAPSTEPLTTSLIASAISSVDNPQTSGYLVSTSTQPYSSAAATLPSESVTPSNVESAIALTVAQTTGSLSYMSYDYTQASLSLDPINSSVSTSSLLTLTTESLLTDSDGVTQLEPSSLFQSITHSLLTTTELTTPALHISTLTLAPDLSFTTTRGQPMTTAAPATNSVPLDASLSVVTNVFLVSSMLDVSIVLDVTLTFGLDFNTPTSTSATVKATSGLSTGIIQSSSIVINTETITDLLVTYTETTSQSDTYMLTAVSETGLNIIPSTVTMLGSNSIAPSSAITQPTDSVLGTQSIVPSASVTGSAVIQPTDAVLDSNTIVPSISVTGSANTQTIYSVLGSNSIVPTSSVSGSVSIQETVSILDALSHILTRTLTMVNVGNSDLESPLNTSPTTFYKPSYLTLDSTQIAPTTQIESSSLTDTKTISFVAMTPSVVFPTHLTSITEQLNTPSLSTGNWPTNSGMISGSAVVTMTLSLSDIAPPLSSSFTSLGFVSLSSAPGTKTLDTLTQSGSTRTDTLSNSALTSGAIDANATASLDTSLLIRPSTTDLTYTGVVASTNNLSPSQPTTSDSNYGSGGHSSGVTLHPTASSSLSTSSPPPANVTIPPPGLNSRQEDDRDKIIAITVGVIGGALFIFAIIIAIFCWRRRQIDRSYETMDAQSTSSDQRSDTSEEIPSKTPDAVNFNGIIPRFPNYKDYNGWDTFRPPYFTMIDIGPTAHNIIKGSVVSPEDATLTKKSSFKKKSSTFMKSVQFVNPLVEEIEPDYDATVSISSNGKPKKGIIVKTVKFNNTVTESNDFEDAPREDTDKEQSYEYPHQTFSDYDYATVSFSGENKDSHGTYDTLGTVSDSPAKTNGPPPTSFQSNTPNGHTPNNTVEESTHF
ncbi:mucin-5AC-like isoform X3 [Biomphalaria pfeifferi]|uniref:Mucin-5AC-like isoform X3 n=1 Tax=Biomphalaria pfeifferi TaxID=112525 RepID=A0AAD8B9M7_BIOPF|nr:mucin-5AC-like isoform X3 [Biomphalaria pfeifferi]